MAIEKQTAVTRLNRVFFFLWCSQSLTILWVSGTNDVPNFIIPHKFLEAKINSKGTRYFLC